MKKLLLILFALIMSLSIFASCNTETDNSSDVSVLSENESSNDMSDVFSVSDNASESDESENPYISNLPYDYVIPEFDKSKVIYNPDSTHIFVYNDSYALIPNFGVPFDKDKFGIGEYIHEGLREYIKNSEIPNDAWFPVCIIPGRVRIEDGYVGSQLYIDSYRFEGLPELLERIGFVEDEELSEKLSVEIPDAKIGYINIDMLWKIHRDGYSGVVKVIWYPKKCESCGFDAT